jgi:Rrf2 family cysteine metabolism transcriptional repressor
MVDKVGKTMFAISTKGRYATRAMLEVASHDENNPVRLRDISKAQKISEKYLGRIMVSMVSAGLVRSRRGKNGGFILAASPTEITILDILQAVEGPVVPAPCVDTVQACRGPKDCVTQNVWMRVKDAIMTVLAGITLDDLVKLYREKRNHGIAPNHFI